MDISILIPFCIIVIVSHISTICFVRHIVNNHNYNLRNVLGKYNDKYNDNFINVLGKYNDILAKYNTVIRTYGDVLKRLNDIDNNINLEFDIMRSDFEASERQHAELTGRFFDEIHNLSEKHDSEIEYFKKLTSEKSIDPIMTDTPITPFDTVFERVGKAIYDASNVYNREEDDLK